jgi:hypothetical protein
MIFVPTDWRVVVARLTDGRVRIYGAAPGEKLRVLLEVSGDQAAAMLPALREVAR